MLCFAMYISSLFGILIIDGITGQTTLIATHNDIHIELVCNLCKIRNPKDVVFKEKSHGVYISVREDGDSCRTMSYLPNIMCGCILAHTVACNISLNSNENECQRWRCWVNDGVIYSEPLDVCFTGIITSSPQHSHLSKVQRPIVNCSDEILHADVVHWILEDRYFKSNIKSVEIMKLNMQNISVLTHLLTIEANQPIDLCTVSEENETEWSITILYIASVCSEDLLPERKLSKPNHTCYKSNGNPKIIKIIEEFTSAVCPSVNIFFNVNLSLCEAFNRDNFGPRKFPGNASVKILYPASIREFYLVGFIDQQNITMTGKRNLTFVCNGFGDPPPRMNLTSDSLNVSTNNSFLRLDISLTSSQDSGTFICIATNGIGADHRSIHVQANIPVTAETGVTITHEYVNETSIQLTCTVDSDAPKSVGFFEYLFGKPSKVLDVVRSKNDCHVQQRDPRTRMNCHCIDASNFRCTLTGLTSADEGNGWQCSVSDGNVAKLSEIVRIQLPDLPEDNKSKMTFIVIILAGAGLLLLIMVVVAVVCVYRIYRRMKSVDVIPMNDLTSRNRQISPIPVIDQNVIYHEIDPDVMATDMRFRDDLYFASFCQCRTKAL